MKAEDFVKELSELVEHTDQLSEGVVEVVDVSDWTFMVELTDGSLFNVMVTAL